MLLSTAMTSAPFFVSSTAAALPNSPNPMTAYFIRIQELLFDHGLTNNDFFLREVVFDLPVSLEDRKHERDRPHSANRHSDTQDYFARIAQFGSDSSRKAHGTECRNHFEHQIAQGYLGIKQQEQKGTRRC